ncbi:MAG TPA: nitroreductase family protein [Gaiellaceae bacterium]|nr:nitroreductase family protein [Gaiellaceae bacterium]
MDVFDTMRTRRMYRHFLPEPPDEALLERLVYAAGRAPVAREGLRHLVVVSEPATMAAIRLVAPGFYNDAPGLIAVCADLELAVEVLGEVADEVCALDAGAAGGYLSLAAPALGLAICWTTSWTPPPVQAVLGLPERIKPYLLVAVGHPAPDAPRAPRRFEPAVHRERFSE